MGILRCILSLSMLIFISADRFHKTSVDPHTMYITINIGEEKLSVNLEAPGLVIKKYPDGSLKYLSVPFINSLWDIYFHPPKDNMELERVSLVQRSRMMENRHLLDGWSESYSEIGRLISKTHWERGFLDGKSYFYDHDRNLIEEQEYDEGFPVNTWKHFYANGKTSSSIHFPSRKSDWAKTFIPRLSHLEKSILSMSHISPLETTETWFDQDGFKTKEIKLKLYQDGERYFVLRSGESISYDIDGNITQVKKEFFDNGETHTKLYFSQFGNRYVQKQAIYDSEVFNEVLLND